MAYCLGDMLYKKRITADLVLLVGKMRTIVGTYLESTILSSAVERVSNGLNLGRRTVTVSLFPTRDFQPRSHASHAVWTAALTLESIDL